jgi:cytochrome c biogenesis protein CcdA
MSAITQVSARKVLLVSAITLGVIAAAVFLGLRHPAAQAIPMSPFLPAVTLGTIVVAGAVDGINPCAFTVLLLFITALLAGLQTKNSAEIAGNVAAARARLIGLGSIYIAAIFLTYLALGAGLLVTADLFVREHLPARLGALLAIALGLWMLKDYFLPGWGWRLQAPAAVGEWARRAAQKMTVPALALGGFLIGLCTVPCSGAVYLAVLALLSTQPTATAFGYLVLYNLMFIIPLVVVLLAASARPTLNRLARWNLHHKEWVRLALGSGVVVMGLAILATV